MEFIPPYPVPSVPEKAASLTSDQAYRNPINSDHARVGLQFSFPSQRASGPMSAHPDPLPSETSFLGHPSNISLHVEAGVGVAGNWRQYGSVEDQLPLSISLAQGQSTTPWSFAACEHVTQYGAGAAVFRPGTVCERCMVKQPANFSTGGAAECPAPAIDGAYAGPYQGASTNPPHAPSRTEGDRSSLPTPPPWRYAARLQESPSSIPGFVPPEARSRVSATPVHQLSGSQTFSHSAVQPVPTSQRFSVLAMNRTSWEAHGHEIEAQLPNRVPQCSRIPVATHDAFSISNQLYGQENRRLMIPPSDAAGHVRSNSMGPDTPPHPEQVVFPQSERPHWTQGFVSEGHRGTRASYSETRSMAPTQARLQQPIWRPAFAPPSGGTSFLADSDATGTTGHRVTVESDGYSPVRHSEKGKRPSLGVHRTERPRRGKAAGKPLYLQRKEHVSLESNVETLQTRCSKQGGDNEAIGHLSVIFMEGVNPKALNRKVTEEEIAKQAFGPSTEQRQVYWALVSPRFKDESVRYVCRLCSEEKRYPYKNGKDVVPHIWKCHIGIESNAGNVG